MLLLNVLLLIEFVAMVTGVQDQSNLPHPQPVQSGCHSEMFDRWVLVSSRRFGQDPAFATQGNS